MRINFIIWKCKVYALIFGILASMFDKLAKLFEVKCASMKLYRIIIEEIRKDK